MKKFLGRYTLSLLLTTQVEVTPVFSAQYKMKCNSCHSIMPTLNKTGLMF